MPTSLIASSNLTVPSPVTSPVYSGTSKLTLTCDCARSEEHTSELQSQSNLVCRLLLEKKKIALVEGCRELFGRYVGAVGPRGLRFRLNLRRLVRDQSVLSMSAEQHSESTQSSVVLVDT